MTQSKETAHAAVWEAVERDRRRDRTLRRVSVAAWSVTFAAVLVYASMIVIQILDLRRLVAAGIAVERSLFLAAIPLVGVIGVLAVLIATLATIGMFLRARTASLQEIQQRLAALEAVVVQRTD
jgi:hypothetical protein